MTEIRNVDYLGERAIELTDGRVRMIVLYSVGPRIAWFGFVDRDNVLFWDAAGAHTHRDWRLYGGHRLWTTRPLADESEEVFAPDNQPCEVVREPDSVIVSAPSTSFGIEKSLTIRAQGETWQVEHRLHNASAMLWSGGAWALTCTAPRENTVYRIPLGGGPLAWDVTTIVIPMKWGGTHASRLDDEQFSFSADALEVRPQRDEAKRMVFAPQGVMEMRNRERGLFRKTTALQQGLPYPLGCNLAIYLGPERFMIEMESMSPVRTLAPGESLVHCETWTLESF